MKSFLWGTATASHQVEGGNFNNDWWAFEQEGFIHDGSSSHPVSDHWNLFEKDFDLLEELGCNAYRFSLEWSRIIPERGKVSSEALEHYRQMITSLKKRNIIPVITLHHFTHPLWFANRGGWENASSVEDFSFFVKTVIDSFGQEVDYWITFNEVNCLLGLGYLMRYWPPRKKNPLAFIRSFRSVVKAHRQAYQIIHQSNQDAWVGIAHHYTVLYPWKDKIINRGVRNIYHWVWNKSFPNAVKNSLDFLGLNYYACQQVSFPWKLFPQPGKEVGFAQWEYCPEGFSEAVRDYSSSYHLPIMITECGMPHDHGIDTQKFLIEIISQIDSLRREEGIDLSGFFYWSLIDNFEWKEGLSVRFGLYEVDYETQERKIRPVGEGYQKYLKSIQFFSDQKTLDN